MSADYRALSFPGVGSLIFVATLQGMYYYSPILQMRTLKGFPPTSGLWDAKAMFLRLPVHYLHAQMYLQSSPLGAILNPKEDGERMRCHTALQSSESWRDGMIYPQVPQTVGSSLPFSLNPRTQNVAGAHRALRKE